MQKLIAFLIALMVAGFTCLTQAQVPMTGAGIGAPSSGGGGYAGPGDVISGALAWHGLRGYDSADTADPADVCLPADSVCAHLTLSNGNVVVPASLVSCNITTVICTIKTLFDKGSLVKNLTQGTIANRPTFRPAMASNGCPTTALPCMKFTAANGPQIFSSGATQSQPITTSVAFYRTSGIDGDLFYWGIANLAQGTNTVREAAGSAVLGTATDNAFHALMAVFNSTTSAMYIDASATPACSSTVTCDVGTGAPSNTVILLGGGVIVGYYDGYILEAGIWAGAKTSADAISLSNNQRSYWGF